MRELDITKIYDLSELTGYETNQLLEKLISLDSSWDGESSKVKLFMLDFLYFSTDHVTKGEWIVADEIQYTEKEIVNAKELFSNKEENFKKLVEVLNEELTEKTYKGTEYEVKYISEKPKQYQIGIDTFNPQPHYNNKNGSLYKIANDLGLNHWEFDIFKRLVRCRKKNQFKEDLQKIKDTIDIYLNEFKD